MPNVKFTLFWPVNATLMSLLISKGFIFINALQKHQCRKTKCPANYLIKSTSLFVY